MAQKGPSMDLSSFQDIMTCILGILILIILLTGIDASQIVMLVATPCQALEDDRSAVYFECRNNQLFRIDRDKLKQLFDEKTQELLDAVQGDETEFLKRAASTVIKVDGQRFDYGMAMTGRYTLYPDDEAEGFSFPDKFRSDSASTWFGKQLAELDPEHQFICFFVRPDSFNVFQKARTLAWLADFSITCELQQAREPIDIGNPSGERVMPQ